MLVRNHYIHKETGLVGTKIICTMWILTLFSKYLTLTVTTFTQRGPVEDHSQANRAPILQDEFNLKHNIIIKLLLLQLSLLIHPCGNQAASVQPHPTYLSPLKRCRVELCTELSYAIIPTLFLCFLLICYPYIFLHFSVLIFVLLFNSYNHQSYDV